MDAFRRPRTIHHLPEETVAQVIEVRWCEGWCSEAIETYLKAQRALVITETLTLWDLRCRRVGSIRSGIGSGKANKAAKPLS